MRVHAPCGRFSSTKGSAVAPAARGVPRRIPHVVSAQRDGGGAPGGQRESWDVGRFARTLAFFNGVQLTPGGLIAAAVAWPARALASMLPSAPTAGSTAPDAAGMTLLLPANGYTQGIDLSGPDANVVLVTGATGGVGKRVVERLLARGRVVRALVRDVDKAKSLLAALPTAPGAALQLAAADLTQRATLRPAMFDGVKAVISCSAVKVAPKEGDTADRAKYYQGIQFFDPEIVEDTPEAVELRGLCNLLDAVGNQLGLEGGQVIMAPGDAALLSRWGALDDVVMGGVSESSMVLGRDAGEAGGPALVFKGNVSTSNSGGFISVRSTNYDPPLNLSAYAGLRLRLRGNGLRYKAILRSDAAWDGVGFCKSFDTVAGEWHDVLLPFSDFVPTFRARTLRDGSKFDASRLCSMQLMLSKFEYDGELNPHFSTGAVELPIESITTYLAPPVAPRFVHVSSAGVTRPNRPGIDVDQEPPAVKLNDALGGLLTYKLAGEDALRSSGVPMAVVRPCALTEEPAGMPIVLDQGDVIKGKIGREDVADLCVALLDIPSATGCTFEVKSSVPFSQPWAPEPGTVQQRDWAAELAVAGMVRGVTGKTVAGVYSGRRPEAEVAAEQQQQAQRAQEASALA